MVGVVRPAFVHHLIALSFAKQDWQVGKGLFDALSGVNTVFLGQLVEEARDKGL